MKSGKAGMLALMLALTAGAATDTDAGKFSGIGRAISRGSMTAGGAGGGPVDLSRDQLRTCVVLDRRLGENATSLSTLEKSLTNEGVVVDALAADVEQKRPGIDRTDAAAVKRFNAGIAEIRRRDKTLEEKVRDYNARLASHNKDTAAFNADCAKKSYREADMRALNDEMSRKN